MQNQLTEMLVHCIYVYTSNNCESNAIVTSASRGDHKTILPKNKQYFKHLVRPSLVDTLAHVALYVFKNKKLYNLTEYCDNFKKWLHVSNINVENCSVTCLWQYSILFSQISAVNNPIVSYFDDAFVPEYYIKFFAKLVTNSIVREEIENHVTVINQFVQYTGHINTELLEYCMQEHFIYMDNIFVERINKSPKSIHNHDNRQRNDDIDLYASSSEMLEESETEMVENGTFAADRNRKKKQQVQPPKMTYESRLPGRKAYLSKKPIDLSEKIPKNFDLETYAKNCIEISAEILGTSEIIQQYIRNEYISYQNLVSTINDNANQSNATCSICYAAFVSVVVGCGHTFCLNCVRGFQRTSSVSVKCPTCNEISKFNLCSYIYIA